MYRHHMFYFYIPLKTLNSNKIVYVLQNTLAKLLPLKSLVTYRESKFYLYLKRNYFKSIRDARFIMPAVARVGRRGVRGKF